jgi:hypothetical protein
MADADAHADEQLSPDAVVAHLALTRCCPSPPRRPARDTLRECLAP